MYICVYLSQKLLLLPELSGIAITSTNSDPVKKSSKLYVTNMMCTHELANKETTYSNAHGIMSNNTCTARIAVNGLIASWTNVHKYLHGCLTYDYVFNCLGEREINFRWYQFYRRPGS